MTSPNDSRVFRLKCEPNNYPWGEVGKDSLAAVLAQEGSGDLKIDYNEPYAELWMGTHPTNPAHLFSSPKTLLSDHIAKHPELLGDAKKFPARYPSSEKEEFGGQGHVPFLFKILTCKQALPLQIHPNVELSKKLHEQDPEQFSDTNHKPEIAVCLSDRFLGFAGIRPLVQSTALLAVPEIKLLPDSAKSAVDNFLSNPVSQAGSEKGDWGNLRDVFEEFISMDGPQVEKAVTTFCDRVKRDGKDAFKGISDEITQDDKARLAEAVTVLDKYNRADGSIFASLFLMNLVELKKGEGMYVGADSPHAWLSGEIVELMAASDNVLNVGFTPDKNSTRLVAQAITATPTPSTDILLKREKYHKGKEGHTTVFATPFEEFSILRIAGSETLEPITGPGIAIVTDSNGTTISDSENKEGTASPKGSIWFVGAGATLKVGGEGEVWMAFYDGDKKSAGEVGEQ